MQGQLNNISRQLDFMTEQIRLMNQRAFGRKTDINTSTFVDENGVIYEQLQLDNVGLLQQPCRSQEAYHPL